VQSRLDAARQLWEEREESVEVLKRLQRQLADSAEEVKNKNAWNVDVCIYMCLYIYT
tara:strand:- start:54 stop:224 length:171 start_codon:yes stop_codon:yes gene_type:complete